MTETTIRPVHGQQEIHQRILRAWFKMPELRLGQLLSNATYGDNDGDNFYTEDENLAAAVEKYAAKHESPHAHITGPERHKARLQEARYAQEDADDYERQPPAVETPEELIETTEKELVVRYLDTPLGDRLKRIYGPLLLKFITPAMYEAIDHAVAWIPDPILGPRGVRHVNQYHQAPDREIESVVRCLIAGSGEL